MARGAGPEGAQAGRKSGKSGPSKTKNHGSQGAQKRSGARNTKGKKAGPASDKPAEASSKVAPADLPVIAEVKKKRRRTRVKLDAETLEALSAVDLQPEKEPVDLAQPHQDYKGTRTLLGGDDKRTVKRPRRKTPKDQRRAEGHILVKRLKSSPATGGRGVPAPVEAFLKDHFYGDRLKRTAGVTNRRSGLRPARFFRAKK
eukprot:m.460471 g.460471  ORF g.460471 m.460471 type:complete len:201 (-) comp22041_c0_seq1:17-619(-)